jgi:hypothetical protein
VEEGERREGKDMARIKVLFTDPEGTPNPQEHEVYIDMAAHDFLQRLLIGAGENGYVNVRLDSYVRGKDTNAIISKADLWPHMDKDAGTTKMTFQGSLCRVKRIVVEL